MEAHSQGKKKKRRVFKKKKILRVRSINVDLLPHNFDFLCNNSDLHFHNFDITLNIEIPGAFHQN